MSEETLPKYKDPIWQDKDNRHIVCRILQPDDIYAIAHVIAGPESDGKTNRDYDALMESFGEEEIDRLTDKHKVEQLRKREIEAERNLAKQARKKQEVLFNMKLEAFEIEEIKNSTNRELKKRLRKAKSPIEVQAFATLLIQDALNNAE
jgi:hypothetical protein